MRNLIWSGALALLVTLGSSLDCREANAQCATCPTPVVAYSPVVHNTFQIDEGWYPGKLLGRLGQRLFGTAPAAAYPNYTAAYPMTYAASFAPISASAAVPTYATSYAPACTTCSANPCCCQQTTYRPVIMQPAVEQATSYAPGCSTCGTTTATVYDVAPAAGCANCTTNYADQAIHQAPVGASTGQSTGGVAPPPTFRESERYEPTPASGAPANEAATNFQPPQLFAPGDKQAKRPSTNVWTAVYEQPTKSSRAESRAVSASHATPAPAKKQPTVTWVAVE